MTVRLLLLLGLLVQQAAPKAKPPAAAELEPAKKVLRDAFKGEYANRQPDAQKRFAEKLRDEGLRVKDPTETFAWLEEARDAAVRSGDVDLSVEVIGAIAKRYDVDAAKMTGDALEELRKKVKTPEAIKALAKAYAEAFDDAAAAGNADGALTLLPKVEAAAKAAKDEPTLARLKEREKDLRELQTEQREVASARKKLGEAPDDPGANATLGIYRCLTEGDWTGGAACLAKAGDAALSKVGKLEQGAPAEPPAQEALGDAWWEAARSQKARHQDGFRDRAFHWYETALKKQTGLAKLALERKTERLAEELAGKTRQHKVLGYRLKARPRGATKLGSHWYQSFPEPVPTREEAQKRCREMGGYLVCVETEEEQTLVEKLAEKNKVWIGGLIGDDKWAWMNGQPLTFQKWAAGQPNNGKNCLAQFWPGQGWHDIPAGEQAPYPAGFICEWEF